MKTKLSALFLLFFITVDAQITDLQKLSSGRYYDSDVIKDEDNNIKGYFLLFEKDKVNKETYTLEYVVLDENLKKVTSGIITEMKFESFLIKADKISTHITLFDNKLLIQLYDDIGDGNDYVYSRYKILDLKTNELSNSFIYNKGALHLNHVFDRKLKNMSDNQSYRILGLNKIGLVVDKSYKDDTSKEKYLECYDDNYTKKWKTVYEEDKTKLGTKNLSLLKSNENYILYFNHYMKGLNYKPSVSVIIVDAKTGNLNSEYFFPNEEDNSYKIVDCIINDDQIVLLGNYSGKSKYGHIADDDNLGLFKITLNAKNGKVVEEKYLDWTSIGSKLEINKKGYIKKEGYIFIHNLISLPNGKIIVICEAFNQSPIITNNIYFMELSKDFKLNQLFEVEKFRNKFPSTNAHSNEIKKYGLFDFMDYQNMGDGEYLFYLNDNEKNSKNRKKSTLFGIVSYVDGKFVRQTLNLKTETSSIRAFPAKKGYIMIIENFDAKDKATELRLEKINY